MRKPEYISPSALGIYLKDPTAYYMQYLAADKPIREPQTFAMSVGSSFDAYVKSYLHGKLFGPTHKDADKFKFETIFESQVESQNRDRALEAGKECWKSYKDSGALADLMIELDRASDAPKFEFDLLGVIHGEKEHNLRSVGGIPLLGKPDLRFINHQAAQVVVDFKVNGWVGKGNTSPMKGYIQLRERQTLLHAGEKSIYSWKRCGGHKDAVIAEVKGLLVNAAANLESCNEDWARQMTIYSWLMGADVGRELLTGIEQLVFNNSGTSSMGNNPRIASHRNKIGRDFQMGLLMQLDNLWHILSGLELVSSTIDPVSGKEIKVWKPGPSFYYFRELSFEDSKKKCELLDKQASGLSVAAPEGSDAEFYRTMNHQPW